MIGAAETRTTAVGRYRVDDVRRAASGRWPEILASVGGIARELLDGNHHPCPKCPDGGTDRFRMIDASAGALFCNRCFKDKNGDGFAAIRWLTGANFPDAVDRVGRLLGVADMVAGALERVATAKRMPPASMLAYGAVADRAGVRFPTYGPDGHPCSTFWLGDTGKGLNEKGKSAGLFLPGKLPQAGETWIVVEGVKDAAALHGLGYLACGLPTNRLNRKFSSLFSAVDVIVLPDADQAGQEGAVVTAGNLAGSAASIRIARIPQRAQANGGDA